MKSRRFWNKISMGSWQEVLVMGYDQSTLYSCMMVSKKKLEKIEDFIVIIDHCRKPELV